MTSTEKNQLGAILIIAGFFLLAPKPTARVLYKWINDQPKQPAEVVDVECEIIEEKEEEKE